MGYRFNDNINLNSIDGLSSILVQLSKDEAKNIDNSEQQLLRIAYYLYFKKDLDLVIKSSKDTGFVKLNESVDVETFCMFYKAYKNKEEHIDYDIVKELQELGNHRTFNREIYLNEINQDEEIINENEVVKLYKSLSYNEVNFISGNFHAISSYTFSNMESVIYNLFGRIVGYRYSNCSEYAKEISVETFDSMYKIVYFYEKIVRNFLNDVGKLSRKNIEFGINNEEEFSIEDYLRIDSRKKSFKLAFVGIDNFFRFLRSFDNSINKSLQEELAQMTVRMCAEYILRKYPEAKKDKELYKIKEFRYITAGFAEEIIGYIKNNNYSQNCFKAYDKFIKNYSNYVVNGEEYAYYNGCYNKEITFFKDIVFLDELKSKYDILNKEHIEDNVTLEEDVNFVPYTKLEYMKLQKESNNVDCINYPKEIFALQGHNISLINENYPKLLGYCIGVDKIVYSHDKRDDYDMNMYKFEGYVAKKITGKKLTPSYMSQLDNKSLAYLQLHLFNYFTKVYIPTKAYIPLDLIYFDNTTKKIQIDLLERKIELENYKSNSSFIKYLTNNGPYSNGLIDRIDSDLLKIKTEEKLKAYEDERPNYCSKHNLYYSSSEGMCNICKKTMLQLNDIALMEKGTMMEDAESTLYKAESEKEVLYIKSIKNKEAETEKYLEKIVGEIRLIEIQKLFMPKKLTYNGKEFDGFTFIYDDASTEYYDLADYEKIKNLHRIKGCISLINKVIKLILSDYCFWKNPFGKVLIVRGYPNEVQIVNMECIKRSMRNKDEYNTIMYTINYINEVIKHDINIRVSLPNVNYSMNGLEEIRTFLENYSMNLNKVCRKHGYYEGKYFCCPYCIGLNQQNIVGENIEYLDNLPKNIMNSKLNEGGEAVVYKYLPGKVLKVFKNDEVDLDYKSQVVSMMIAKNRQLKEIEEKVKSENKYSFRYITIDKMVIDRRNNTLHSYIMEEIKAIHASSLKNRKYIDETLNFSRKEILEILINLGKGIEYLHELNIFIGDLNGRNIMFDKNRTVYFIDFDGMGVESLHPEFFTDGYIDPVSKNNNTVSMKDDWYSYAIQAFYYLTYVHPFNGIEEGKNEDIITRMEQRNSIIGNPNIKLPSVAIDWDWMPDSMINAFKSIFEGEYRESIVPLLERYYDVAYGKKYNNNSNIPEFKEIKTAPQVKKNPFEVLDITNDISLKTKKIINDYAYIVENEYDENEYYLKINKSYGKYPDIPIRLMHNIVDVIVKYEMIFVIYKPRIEVYGMDGTLLFSEYIRSENEISLNDCYIYYTMDQNIIKKTEVSPGGDIETHSIHFKEKMKIKSFSVVDNNKFVIVKEDINKKDYIYCNDDLFYTFEDSDTDYKVIYDLHTKKWLVVRSDGKGVVIFEDGNYKEIEISGIVNCNLYNFVWDYNNIYIPQNNKLIVYNTLTDTKKEIELVNLIDENSKIKINTDGFEIINSKKILKCVFN